MADIVLLTDPHGKALTNAPPGLGFSILSNDYATVDAERQIHLVVREGGFLTFVEVLGSISHLRVNLKVEFSKERVRPNGEPSGNNREILTALRRAVKSLDFNIPRIVLIGWSLDEARTYIDAAYGVHLVNDLTYGGEWVEVSSRLIHQKATLRSSKYDLDSLGDRLTLINTNRQHNRR